MMIRKMLCACSVMVFIGAVSAIGVFLEDLFLVGRLDLVGIGMPCEAKNLQGMGASLRFLEKVHLFTLFTMRPGDLLPPGPNRAGRTR